MMHLAVLYVKACCAMNAQLNCTSTNAGLKAALAGVVVAGVGVVEAEAALDVDAKAAGMKAIASADSLKDCRADGPPLLHASY